MKVIHLTAGSFSGGAARGAVRLHQGLLELGVDSYIVADTPITLNVTNVIENTANSTNFLRKINFRWNRFILSKYKDRIGLFSAGNEPFSLFGKINFQEYDVVHLHWINNLMGIRHIDKLAQHSNVVWTIRDMWPFTGGCHYSLDCMRYKIGCGSCPLLKGGSEFFTSMQLSKKKDAFRNIKFVGISDWIAEQAISSGVVLQNNIKRIYNSVDERKFFKKLDVESLRRKHNIRSNKKILIAGAQNLMDPYKGPAELRSFIQNYKYDYHFIFFGKGCERLISGIVDVEYSNVGFVDEENLSDLFNIADTFLMFSKQEGFGKTIIESLMCGTPVIVLPGSAPAEIIRGLPDNCGYVWDGCSDLRPIIESLICHSHTLNIEAIKSSFSNAAIAREYLEVYREYFNSSV